MNNFIIKNPTDYNNWLATINQKGISPENTVMLLTGNLISTDDLLDEAEQLAEKTGDYKSYNALVNKIAQHEAQMTKGITFNTPDEHQKFVDEREKYDLELLHEAFHLTQTLKAQLKDKQKKAPKVIASHVVRRNVATYRPARTRAYRSPTRSAHNSAASHDDGGGGDSDGESEPPAKPYRPLVISHKKQRNNFPFAAAFLRHMLRGLSGRERAT